MLHNGVGPALHVAECGHGAVLQFGCFAGGTCVHDIESNAMGPTVIVGGASGCGGLSAMVVAANATWGMLASLWRVSSVSGAMMTLAH